MKQVEIQHTVVLILDLTRMVELLNKGYQGHPCKKDVD